jgi:hypothetical protein
MPPLFHVQPSLKAKVTIRPVEPSYGVGRHEALQNRAQIS